MKLDDELMGLQESTLPVFSEHRTGETGFRLLSPTPVSVRISTMPHNAIHFVNSSQVNSAASDQRSSPFKTFQRADNPMDVEMGDKVNIGSPVLDLNGNLADNSSVLLPKYIAVPSEGIETRMGESYPKRRRLI